MDLKRRDIITLLALVTWFGLLTGAVEGIASLTIQKFQWQSLTLVTAPSPETVWICPVFDLVLAVVTGLGVAVLAKLVPRLPAAQLLVFLLTTMVLFDWLTFSGHLRGLSSFWNAAIAFVASLGAGRVTHWFGQHEAAAVNFCKKTLPGLAVVTVLATVGVSAGAWVAERREIASLPPVSSSKPLNVLVVIIDTLRADHLSGYGYPRPTSPNLDELARKGVLFENVFASSSWTLPSHASMLTGRFVRDHGAGMRPLDGRWPTIAEVMRSQGYLTAAFSANMFFFCRRVGLGRGFIHFEDFTYSILNLIGKTRYGSLLENIPKRLGLTKEIVRQDAADLNHRALRWIDDHREKPFLIFMNYFDAHNPYWPPSSFRERFSTTGNHDEPVDLYLGRDWPSLTSQQLQDEVDAYDGAIAYADSELGALLSDLKKRGLTENTLVVVTADHGESFGEHGLYLHQNSLYLETIRVPLVILGPAGLVPVGVRVGDPVSNVALGATIIDLVGISDKKTFPGPSLRQFWEEPKLTFDSVACIESELETKVQAAEPIVREDSLKSLVTAQWHYILHEKLGPELYDWRSDPRELQNLNGTPEGQMVSASLKQRLESGCW